MPSTPSSPAEPGLRRRGLLALIALAVVAIVAGATTWAVVDSGETETPAARLGPGCSVQLAAVQHSDEAPVFRAPGLRGGCVDLSRYRGRPVVVNFWASYCNPCRKEFPLFKRALREHRQQKLEIVGVSHDDIDADARAFADEFGATWPLALDPDDAIADAYVLRPPGLPHSYFIRRDGTISAHVFGETSARELNAEIAKITRR